MHILIHLVLNNDSISRSDVLFELFLQITRFANMVFTLSMNQLNLITQTQNLLNLTTGNLQQNEAATNLTISNAKINIFQTFQNTLQNVSNFLSPMMNNSDHIVNSSTLLSTSETIELVQTISDFTAILATLGK